MNALAASLFAVVFSIQGEIDEAASKGGEFLGTTPAKWLKIRVSWGLSQLDPTLLALACGSAPALASQSCQSCKSCLQTCAENLS